MTDLVEIDYFSDSDTAQDPYAYWEALRSEGPVVREPHHGVVAVTGYAVGVFQHGVVRTTPWLAPILGGLGGLFSGLVFITAAAIVGQGRRFVLRGERDRRAISAAAIRAERRRHCGADRGTSPPVPDIRAPGGHGSAGA